MTQFQYILLGLDSKELVRRSIVTQIGPFKLTDRIEITEWVRERLGVSHKGLVSGSGRLPYFS